MHGSSPIVYPKKIQWNQSIGNIALFGYMVTSIMHIFPSGLPQPSDFIIVLAVMVNLCAFLAQPQARISSRYFYVLSFSLFAFLINITHYIFLPDIAFVKSSLYYLYNASFFILVVSLLQNAPFQTSRALYAGLVIAIVLEVFIIILFPSLRGARETGTFSNPNQLAVWSLLAACMLVLLKAKSRLNILDIVLLLSLGFLQTTSLSKAGIICYMLLGGILFFVPALTNRARFVALFFLMLLGIYGFAESVKFSSIEQISGIQRSIDRLENIGHEKDDSLEGRGYDRIFENPEFLILGAGEGGYSRFTDTMRGYELHSGVGTLFFSYGIVGVALFIGVLRTVLYKNDGIVMAMIGILFLYGLTHQNIRTADFWLFLAICYAYKGTDFSLASAKRLSEKKFSFPTAGLSKT